MTPTAAGIGFAKMNSSKARRRLQSKLQAAEKDERDLFSISRSEADFDFADLAEAAEVVAEAKTNLLRWDCQRLEVLMPPIDYTEPFGGDWVRSKFTGSMLLTPTGIAKTRHLIHEEQKRRFEVTSRWVTLVATVLGALTGVIGTLIGLASVLGE